MKTDSSLRLNESTVRKCAPPTDRPYAIYWDDEIGGFGLRVTAAGVKAFVLDYRVKGTKRRITIGQLGAWTAKAARERAAELRRIVDKGGDPLADRERERDAPLMTELFDRYLNEYAAAKKKARSIGEDRSLIHGGKGDPPKKPFNGVLGKYFAKMQIAAVSYEDVERFHGDLRAKPYRANRALALLSKSLNLAEKWKLRPQNTNPCGHVDRYAEEKRSRYLSADELTRLGKALDATDEPWAVPAAVWLLLLTGARVSELLALKWTEVDMKAGVARILDAKAGARTVQLSSPALEVMSALPSSGEYVLGGLKYGALAKAWRGIRDAAKLPSVRIHDFRHTTGTMAGAAGYNAFLVRDLLGHKTLAMTGRYVERYDDPVKVAANKIGGQIAAAMKGTFAEVVELGKARKS